MSQKLALKRLTASDLSFFEFYFRAHPDVKQKAINMDAQTLVDALYPSLPDVVETLSNKRVPLDLYLFGPGLQGAHNLQRKILKQQKNWRLNGELVYSPEDFPDRYNDLQPDDFALFEFSGTPVPTSAKIVLIAAGNQYDEPVHAAFHNAFPSGSMFALTDADIEAAVRAADPVDGHPILDWSDQSLAEDVALGGMRSAERLLRRRRGRAISPEDLQRSRSAAEIVGAMGEDLVNVYLTQLLRSGELLSFEWTSNVNAIAPYDFKIVPGNGATRVLDAKSTSGGFMNPLHLSLGEILAATEGVEPYDIYRVFEVTESSAILRIAPDVGRALRPIAEVLRILPLGVDVDSLSLAPDLFCFGTAEIALSFPDEDSALG